MMRKILIPFIFISLVISCSTTYDPLAQRPVFTLLPTEKEIEIGRSYVPLAINENDGRYPDKEVQAYVENLGKLIAKHTPRKLDYQFYVVNSQEINAFALPGGFIFVNRGLILALNKEDELVGVLAHELAHVNARHHARFLEKVFGLNLLLTISAILVSDKEYGRLLMNIGQIGAVLISLKWSRDQEREADRYGVVFTYKAGYDPRGLLDTFKIFKKLSKSKSRPPEWLLTHPLPETRIKEVSQLIAKLDLSKPLKKDSPQFHKIKKKLEKTKPSYDLYYKAKKVVKKNKTEALRLLNEALKIYPQNNAALTLKSSILLANKKYLEGTKLAVKSAELDNLYFQPHFLAGFGYFKLGRYRESIKYLERAKSLIPSYPDTYYYLGRDYEAIGEVEKAL